MKIKWSEHKLDDGLHDLCGKFNGKYVDVVMHYSGSWSAFFNNRRIVEGLESREAAKKWIENFLGAND